MNHFIDSNRYTFDETLKIWSRPEFEGIPYSDGDEVETKLAGIIKQASDISVMSDELRKHCTDWPTHYYLNKDRVNLLRPFCQKFESSSILEVGAGCGAITRFLGESKAQVLALEGSKRRASIAKSRCRDLENVDVICENFTDFQIDTQFDIITLIGVLEYANYFTPGDNPALEMLKKIRTFLKPNGILIIAIENQVGLKYYAGSPEDHLGVRMLGIEGQYKNNGPQTFGKYVLESMLKEAGFSCSQFTAPFPDYKLPVLLITESGFKDSTFKASDLVAQTVKKDRQLSPPFAFSQENAWKPLFDNKIALDFSNSFLITASAQLESIKLINNNNDFLAYYYSTNRIATYCKETIFKRHENNEITITYNKLFNETSGYIIENFDKDINLIFKLKNNANYYSSGYESFAQKIQLILKTNNWTYKDIASVLVEYLKALEKLSQIFGFAEPFNKKAKLPGKYFDAIAHNVLVNTKKQLFVLIDEEWESSFEPSVGYLIFRSLIPIFAEMTLIAPSAEADTKSLINIIKGIFIALNSDLSKSDIEFFEIFEIIVQKQVSGNGNIQKNWWTNSNQFIYLNALDYLIEITPKIDYFIPTIDELNNKNLELNNNIINLNNDYIQLKQNNQNLEAHNLDLLDNIHKKNYELVVLQSNKQQFDDLLYNCENIFCSKQPKINTSLSYHDRLLNVYNSRLWFYALIIRKIIHFITRK